MEDIIQKYQKKKKKNTIAIIFTSLALAIGLNFYVNSTDIGKSIKSSVLDSEVSAKNSADLSMTSENNLISIKSSKEMKSVKSLSFSLVYNEDNIDIKNKILWFDNAEIVDLSNNSGYSTILINFSHPYTIQAGDDILKFAVEKKDSLIQESLNLSQANFVDSEDNLYALTTASYKY